MEPSNLDEMASRVETLYQLAQEIFDRSEDFPAINRNAKRLLAAVEMMRINLETSPK